MKDMASTSVEACLQRLEDLHASGDFRSEFRAVLHLLRNNKRITGRHREIRRAIVRDAQGLGMLREDLVRDTLKHVRRQERHIVVHPRAVSVGHGTHSTLPSDES